MKKLLGIVVLGLLWFSHSLSDTNKIYCYNSDNDKIDQWNNYNKCPGNRVQVSGPNSKKPPRFAGLKKICVEIGYVTGTEKFVDCVKDLYIKQLEAKNNSRSQSTELSSETERKIDPSVWDDIFGVSQGMLGGKSSSSSSSSSMSCFKINERVSGTNKICSYNCMGSEVTRNIRSTQICPMSIKQ